MSFSLGIYGDDTENVFEQFKQQLLDAGIEDVNAEFIKQYNAYKELKGI